MCRAAFLGREARVVDRLRQADVRVLLALAQEPEVEAECRHLDRAAAVRLGVAQLQVDLRQVFGARLVEDGEALVHVRLGLVEAEVCRERLVDE